MKKIAIVFLGIVLGGCVTTHQYVPVSDQDSLSPGNALIKVERRSDLAGYGRAIELSDDGKIVGQVASGEFLIWQRPAGIFELRLVPNIFVVMDPVPLTVDARPGKQYEFEIFWGNRTFELKRKIP
jgi:hypothetical protein